MKLLWIGFIFIFIGCSKDPKHKFFDDLNTQANLEQTKSLNFSLDPNLVTNLEFTDFLNQSSFEFDSSTFFNFTEELFILSNHQNLKNLKSASHNFLNRFYNTPNSATQYGVQETLYLPAALGFEGDKIVEKFKSIGSPEDALKLDQIFNSPCANFTPKSNQDFCHALQWPNEIPTYEPKKFLESIIAYMYRTADLMEKLEVSNAFVTGFRNEIKDKYIASIETAYRIIENVNPKNTLLNNTTNLVNALDYLSFLPKEIYDRLNVELRKGKAYAEFLNPHTAVFNEVSNTDTSHPYGMSDEVYDHGIRVLNVIGNIWLDLTPQNNQEEDKRIKYLATTNAILYDNLRSNSEPFLLWISGRINRSEYKSRCNKVMGCVQEYFLSDTVINQYVENLGASCHSTIKAELDKWLSEPSYRLELRNKNPRLFSIFSMFQDSTFKNTILPQFSSTESEVEVGDSLVKVVTQKFIVPYISGRKTLRSFNSKVAAICFDDVQNKIESALNSYILASLDSEIRKYSQAIEGIVSKTTQSSFKEISGAIDSPQSLQSFFETKAFPLLESKIFQNRKLSGLENKNIRIQFSANEILFTENESQNFQTGASVLASSLAANYHRIQNREEKVSPQGPVYYSQVFEQINKMLSMIGFRKMDKSMHISLFRPSPKSSINELDVYKYDCSPKKLADQNQKMALYEETKDPEYFIDWREYCEGYENSLNSYFALPETLELSAPFWPNTNVIFQSKASSQSEILRAASLMLKYFRDWTGTRDDYDLGMGNEYYSGIQIFPKHAFVNLSIALATLPVRGFTKNDSNLYLFGLSGDELKGWHGSGLPQTDPSNPLAMAAVADYLDGFPSREIDSNSLAKFILAADEFLKATEGIENTEASVINPKNKKSKDNLNQIIEGRRLISLLMIGISHFLTTHFQDADGGFWDFYDLDSSSIIKKSNDRSLATQIEVMKALIRVYEKWGSKGVQFSLMKIFEFMNTKLLSSDSYFYYQNESKSQKNVDPYILIRTMNTLNEFKKYIPQYQERERVDSYIQNVSNIINKWAGAYVN